MSPNVLTFVEMMAGLGWMEKVYADFQGYILFWKCQWMDFTKTLMNDFNILIISHTQGHGPGYCCTSRLLGLTKMENKVHTRGIVTVLFDCTICS